MNYSKTLIYLKDMNNCFKKTDEDKYVVTVRAPSGIKVLSFPSTGLECDICSYSSGFI